MFFIGLKLKVCTTATNGGSFTQTDICIAITEVIIQYYGVDSQTIYRTYKQLILRQPQLMLFANVV